MLFGERNENSYESMPDEVEQCQKKVSFNSYIPYNQSTRQKKLCNFVY